MTWCPLRISHPGGQSHITQCLESVVIFGLKYGLRGVTGLLDLQDQCQEAFSEDISAPTPCCWVCTGPLDPLPPSRVSTGMSTGVTTVTQVSAGSSQQVRNLAHQIRASRVCGFKPPERDLLPSFEYFKLKKKKKKHATNQCHPSKHNFKNWEKNK